MSDPIDEIRELHRQRRFAMKLQQKIDRALESYVRINATGWSPDLDAATREKFNKEAKDLIKRARGGERLPISEPVLASDQARKPTDDLRKRAEKDMTLLAEQLPAFAWVTATEGAGALGLATIVAEAGDLKNYPNVAKLWKRLGFAPYDGLAGSTWKRESWRPRKLAAEEWTENPFSGERYALMHQIAIWLVNHQWTGAAKTESGEGEACGPYGQVYGERRKHTAKTHPEWTKMHSRQDALRVAMKAFLRDLWAEWNRAEVVPMPEKKKATRTRRRVETVEMEA